MVDQTFIKLDSNTDGYLSKDELKAGLDSLQQSYTDKELQEVLNLADSDKDGRISQNELSSYIKSTQLEEVQPVSMMTVLLTRADKVEVVFNYYDRDNSSYLEKEEIKLALQDTYGYLTDSMYKETLKYIDDNLDGRIDRAELMEFAKDDE